MSSRVGKLFLVAAIILPQLASGQHAGIQFGTTHNSDYMSIASAPDIFTGVLLTAWTRNPTPGPYPYFQPNKYPFGLPHAGGDPLFCITGNMYAGVTDASHGTYNQNITYSNGDMLGWVCEQTPEAQSLDWCWNAWQFIYSGTSASGELTFREWFRFGMCSPYVFKEVVMTVAQMRTALGNPAWAPTELTSLHIGDDGLGDVLDKFSMTRIKVYEYGGMPTQTELTEIARGNTPSGYPAPWLDVPCEWVGGAADITDVSGNARVLTVTGTLAEGANCDGVVDTTGPYIRQATPCVNISGANSATAVFASPAVAGNTISLECRTNGGMLVVSDDQANTYATTIASTSGGRRALISVAPVATAPVTTITLSGISGNSGTMMGFEWSGVDTANPVDWSVVNETAAEPLTITAGQASSVAGVVGICVVAPTSSYNDYVVQPAGWNAFNGTEIINANEIFCRKRFGAPAIESCYVPDQVGTVTMVGAMVGLRPATDGSTNAIASTDAHASTEPRISAVASNRHISVTGPGRIAWSVRMADMSGRVVVSRLVGGRDAVSIPVPTLAPGTYIVWIRGPCVRVAERVVLK